MHYVIKMDYNLVAEMHVNKLENCLKVSGLKISGNKNKLVARVFCTVGNKVMPVNTAVEVEEDLKRIWKKNGE